MTAGGSTPGSTGGGGGGGCGAGGSSFGAAGAGLSGTGGGGGGSGGFGGYDPFFLLDLALTPTGIERNPAYWDNFDACWLGDCLGVEAFLPVYGN